MTRLARIVVPGLPHHVTTYGVDGLNRLTTAGPASLGYDGRGNLTSVGSVTYAYDAANRLIATGEGASLTYDPIDRLYRTAKSGFQTTKFLYDGPNLIAEYDDAGTSILRRYVHGPGIDEPLVWYEGPTVNDMRWHQADNQGSILAMSQGLGGTLGTYRYDAYGQLFVDPGQISRFQYTGQTSVPEVGLLNYKARMYSPSLGRFMQTDPVGYEAGLNWYAYVGDDPVNKADPTGECAAPGLVQACVFAIGATVGGGLDLGMQLVANGGDFSEVDWKSVGASALIGGAVSALGPTGAVLGRGGAKAVPFGFGNAAGLLNRNSTLRVGWGFSAKADGTVLRAGGKVVKAATGEAHKDLPGIVVKGLANPARDGVVSGVAGAAATKASEGSAIKPARDECKGSAAADSAEGQRAC